MIFRTIACATLLVLPAVTGQTAVFEAASVKPAAPDGHGETRRYRGGRFTATSVTLKALIQRAWDVKDFQITGGPGWVNSEHFDISAKAATNATPAARINARTRRHPGDRPGGKALRELTCGR